MRGSMRLVLAVAATGLLAGGTASAAPPAHDEFYASEAVTVGDGGAIVSDGSSLYSGKEVGGGITDRTEPSRFSGVQDAFFFLPGFKRSLSISSSATGGTSDSTCSWGYLTFRSATDPDWYDTVSGGGASVGDASFVCGVGNNARWVIFYPDNVDATVSNPMGSRECVAVAYDGTHWTFSAGPGTLLSPCIARVVYSVWERGQYVTKSDRQVAAPFSLVVDVEG